MYFGDSFVLESLQSRGMHLCTSGNAPYSQLPCTNDALLPKCLQTGWTYEVNLSPVSSTWKVEKYARFDAKECELYHTGAAFRLYHTQSESFVNASCDAEKDRRYAHAGRDPRKNQQYAHGDATREGVPRAGGDPAHIPYLKTLPDHGDDPDPT